MTLKTHYGNLICIAATCLCVLMLTDSNDIAIACSESIKKAAIDVIPVLLPYSVLSGIIADTLPSGRRKTSVFFCFLASIACGNPIGAILTERLLHNGTITKKEAEIILPAFSCSSPAFCISVVGIRCFKNFKFGIALWLVSILPAIIAAITILAKGNNDIKGIDLRHPDKKILSSAFLSSAKTMGVVAVSMIFFSSLCALAKNLISNEKINAIISSIFELGNGVFASSVLNAPHSFAIASLAVVFCGLSVFLQIAVCAPSIQKKKYIIYKTAYALLSSLFFLHYSAFF